MRQLPPCCRPDDIEGGCWCDKTIRLLVSLAAKWRDRSKSIHRGQEIYHTTLQVSTPRSEHQGWQSTRGFRGTRRNMEEHEELVSSSTQSYFTRPWELGAKFHLMWVSFVFPSNWQCRHLWMSNQRYFPAHLTSLWGFRRTSKGLPLCHEY